MQARLNACACAIVPAFSSSSQLSPTSAWIPMPGIITLTVEKILATSTYFDSSPYLLVFLGMGPLMVRWATDAQPLIRSPSSRVTWRPWRPEARIAWCRYGNPDANALPVPPQPMTAMWTAQPCVRIELSWYSDMGDEFLKRVAGRF